jgi:hypothetical protein
LTYESEDFCFASPVRERRASARERLLSYREPASRNPQDVHTETRLGNPHARAPFRLLSIRAPRQAVLRTSSWLAPSDLHPALRPNGGEDTRCDRPISATHTNYVHPHLARFQLALTGFPVGDAPRSLGLRDACWRTGCFTTPETASADHEPAASLEPTAFRPSGTSVGVFFPRCRYGRASDTPVATAASSSASSTFVDAATWPSSSTFDLARWVGGCCCRRDHP